MFQRQRMAEERVSAEGGFMLDRSVWAQSEEFCDCHPDWVECFKPDGELLGERMQRYWNSLKGSCPAAPLFYLIENCSYEIKNAPRGKRGKTPPAR